MSKVFVVRGSSVDGSVVGGSVIGGSVFGNSSSSSYSGCKCQNYQVF